MNLRNKSRRILFALLTAGLISAAAFLASCGSAGPGSAGYKWSSTTKAIKLPSFVYDSSAPPGDVNAYRFALERPDLLKQVPCYCGCGEEAGHKSNLDCFVRSRNGADVTFDTHGAG